MYDDFDFGQLEPYEVPIYIYNCDLCNAEVKSREIIQCIICKRKLCSLCYHMGFCTNHYEELTPENKSLFNKLSEEHRLREETAKISFYIILIIPFIFWMILILGFFSSLENSVDSTDYFMGNLLLYIIILVFCLICTISGVLGYARSKNKRDREFISKKINLYKGNAKSINK